MDVAQKKQEVLEDIARGPETIVFARIDICNEIQLSDLLKTEFIPYLRGAANTSHSNTDSLHEVCVNLAYQRAILQGAAAAISPTTGILAFNIDDGNAESRANGTAPHNTSGNLSFPVFEDASYSNKTTIPYIVLHDFNETGGTVTLSSSSNANTTITDDDGNDIKYFTDFSKYFLTAGRANGELISIDQNLTPYTTPTASEPFLPANTINGEVLRGVAPDPTANTDVRHEFTIVANTSGGYAGGDLDIAENKYVGNTFVTLELSNVSGTFAASEILTDFEGETATIKTYTNTASVLLESTDLKGTFIAGETLSDSTTNATISSIESTSGSLVNMKLTGNTFLTGSNTDVTLGFSTSNTISLDTGAVTRSGDTVTVIANSHGIGAGERVVLKGADAAFGEFNNTFIVQDVAANTLTFVTSNTTSVSPTGDFTLVKNIIFGQTSNASAAVHQRTVNASANIIFQSSNLSVGFAVTNTVSNDSGSTGAIDSRTIGGAWYQTKTAEVKTYYTTSTSGTWNYDATNNPLGIESTANVGLFWLDNFKPVKINQLTGAGSFALDDGRIQLEDSIGGYLLMDSTDDAGTENVGDNILHEQFDESAISVASTSVAEKIVLDIALATSSDTTGGYDDTAITRTPGIYFAYPLKTYEDQTHDGTVTLEAYDNFANVIIAPEGLEINFDWKPLANTSGVATNTTHLHANGDVVTTAHNPEECTVLDEIEFNSHLGPYGSAISLPQDDIFLSSIASTRSSGKKVGTSGAVYPSANANPFYPAVAGTHKAIANTDNDITGTQPGSLTANDIYAGTYTQIDTGGVDPGTVAAPQDYRYIIQNDLKWVYATSPFAAPVGAATSTGQGQVYNVPRLKTDGTFQALYDGYSKSDGFGPLIDSIESQAGTSHSHDNTIPVDSATRTTGTGSVIAAAPPTLSANSVAGYSSGTATTFNFTDYGSTHAEPTNGTVDTWITSTKSGNKVTTATVAHTTTDVSYDTNSSGTTTGIYESVAATTNTSHQNYTLNAIEDVLNDANTATFVTMVTSLHTGNETTYGAGYRDPNEPSSPNLKTDAVFDANTATMYTAYTNAKNYHDAVLDGTSNGYTNGVAHTYANTTYAAFISEVGTFQTAMTLRISEITARIG